MCLHSALQGARSEVVKKKESISAVMQLHVKVCPGDVINF